MAKIIKLKESDITNIVKRIIRERDEKKGSKDKIPTSPKDLKKLTKSELSKLGKKYFSGSFEEQMKNYTNLYNKSPKWAQSVSLSPADMKSKILEGTPPDDDPAAFFLPILAILSWVIAAWSFCCFTGNCGC